MIRADNAEKVYSSAFVSIDNAPTLNPSRLRGFNSNSTSSNEHYLMAAQYWWSKINSGFLPLDFWKNEAN